MTQFIPMSQFALEHGTKSLKNLKEPLYVRHHSNGETTNVEGVEARGREIVYVALSKNLNGKSATELASMAARLSVCIDEYLDKEGKTQKSYILCTNKERETVGEAAELVF